MNRRPPKSTQSRSSAASDVYKRQLLIWGVIVVLFVTVGVSKFSAYYENPEMLAMLDLSLIHISEPTRPY